MRLYIPLEGAYYRSYGCVLLSRGIRRRRLSGVHLLATGVYNYERFACITVYYVLLTRLSACTVECIATTGCLWSCLRLTSEYRKCLSLTVPRHYNKQYSIYSTSTRLHICQRHKESYELLFDFYYPGIPNLTLFLRTGVLRKYNIHKRTLNQRR